jgi:cytidylate kinase
MSSIKLPITINMENQLKAWFDKIKGRGPETSVQPCITLSREFGCQGYPVAEALKRLLEEVAARSGFSITRIDSVSQADPVFRSMISLFTSIGQASSLEIFEYTRQVIREAATRGNCIIVGRGGTIITQSLPRCLHVRLIAPLEFRVRNIAQTQNLEEEAARKLVATRQSQREEYFRHFTHASASDPEHYHMILNNARHTPDEIARLVAFQLENLGLWAG